MSDLCEENHLGHFCHLPQHSGCNVKKFDNWDLTLINSPVSTSMFNIAFGGRLVQNRKDVEQVIEFFQKRPFAWWIPSSHKSPSLTKLLLEENFVVETVEHAMICDLKDAILPTENINLHVIQVRESPEIEENSSLNDFISILEPYDSNACYFYRSNFGKSQNAQQEKLFVGYSENKPVTIGILFNNQANGSSAIFSLLTKQEMRGQGYGTEMMQFLMTCARNHGSRYISLSASSDSGFRIYTRLGFVKCGEFECLEYKNAT